MEQYTFIGFLIASVIGLAGFSRWLIVKLLLVVKENTEAFRDLKNAIYNNTQATTELKQTINQKL